MLTYLLIIQLLAVLLLIVYYIYMPRENKKDVNDLNRQAADILSDANKKAENIIEKAVQEAQKTLIETEYLKQELQLEMSTAINKALDKSLETITGSTIDFKDSYQNIFNAFKIQYSEEAKKIIEKLKEEAEAEIIDFGKILKRETIDAQKIISANLTKEFENKKAEVEVYKKTEIDNLKISLNKLTAKLLEDILGRAITVDEQEKLVIDALEKAKKEGLFLE